MKIGETCSSVLLVSVGLLLAIPGCDETPVPQPPPAAELPGEDAAPNVGDPQTVSLCADGDTLVQQQELSVQGRDEYRFGSTVAVSEGTAVVGEWLGNGVYVFRYNGSTWVKEPSLPHPDPSSVQSFGESVAMSGDRVVATGGTQRGCTPGMEPGTFCRTAHIYRFDGTDWINEASFTLPDHTSGWPFTSVVSISGDVVVVGEYQDFDLSSEGYVQPCNCGAAHVFRLDGNSWIEEQKLTASDITSDDYYGQSVCVDGVVTMVGASRSGCAAGIRCGAVYAYRYNGLSWVDEQKLTASDARARDGFGISISISGDMAVVGANDKDCVAGRKCGAAYIYDYDGSSWVETQKLTASDANALDYFGRSVSAHGDTIVVGASSAECATGRKCGAVYVFAHDGSSWVETQRLTASDIEDSFGFGSHVSVDGNTIIAGAPLTPCARGTRCGAAYLFGCSSGGGP